MAAILGRTAILQIAKDATTPVTKGGLTDLSISMNAGEIDTTTFDSAGVRSYVKGNRDMTFDFSFVFDDTGNAAQEDVLSSWHNLAGDDGTSEVVGGILDFKIMLEGASGQMTILGDCFLTSVSYSTGEEDVQRVDCSARVNAITTYDFLPAA